MLCSGAPGIVDEEALRVCGTGEGSLGCWFGPLPTLAAVQRMQSHLRTIHHTSHKLSHPGQTRERFGLASVPCALFAPDSREREEEGKIQTGPCHETPTLNVAALDPSVCASMDRPLRGVRPASSWNDDCMAPASSVATVGSGNAAPLQRRGGGFCRPHAAR